MDIERPVSKAAFLGQDSLVLRRGNAPARSYANVNTAFVPNWRRVRRVYSHQGYVAALQGPLLYLESWRRQYVAVRLHVGQLPQQIVGYWQARRDAVVAHSNEQDSRPTMVR